MSIAGDGARTAFKAASYEPNGETGPGAEWSNSFAEGGRCCPDSGGDWNSSLDDAAAKGSCPEPQSDDPRLEDEGPRTFAFSRRLVCLSAADGAAAASYRSAQAHLAAGHISEGRRALALCSPRTETGCTTVAVNLAVACAQAGINTLLIDANLARPAVHDFIRPEFSTGGLVQMLLSEPDKEESEICRNVRPNLAVLFAGSLPAEPHLLAQPRFKTIIDHCVRSFEFTIIDSPAGLDGTDARRAAMTVRSAMLVAKRDVTLLAEMKQAAGVLASDRVRLVGSFLTDF